MAVVSASWRDLAPHKPLAELDHRYVARGDQSGGEYLARLVEASPQNIILVGPAGIGKSTELAQAAGKLGRKARLVRMDRLLNLQQATRGDLMKRLGDHLLGGEHESYSSLEDYLLGVLRNIEQRLLLLDGLEKAPEEVARGFVQFLFDHPEDIQSVVVLPPTLAMGPMSYPIASQSRVVPMRVQNEPIPFLLAVLERRLSTGDWPEGFRTGARGVAYLSGGVARVFLQIILNAGTNAALAGREWPNDEDFYTATKTQADSLVMLLREGDREVLRAAKALENAGIEIPLERRLRLLSHGLLLEIELSGKVMVVPIPLLQMVIT